MLLRAKLIWLRVPPPVAVNLNPFVELGFRSYPTNVENVLPGPKLLNTNAAWAFPQNSVNVRTLTAKNKRFIVDPKKVR